MAFESRVSHFVIGQSADGADSSPITLARRSQSGFMARQSGLRPAAAVATLALFLGAQCVLPAAMTLSGAKAEQKRQATILKAKEGKVPSWYLEARQKELASLAKPQQLQNLQSQNLLESVKARVLMAKNEEQPKSKASRPGRTKASATLYNPDKRLSPLKLDLKENIAPEAISASGMDCGGMFPTSEARPEKLAENLEKVTVVKNGKPAKLTPAEISAKVKKLKDANLDFARAIEKWNAKKYREAVPALEKHITDYPESPWVQEARMHVADNAQWTGLFTDSILLYQQVVEETSPGFGNPTFDVHWKAVQKWAGVDILLGRFADAEAKVEHMRGGDKHWRRLTWASYWKQTLQMFKANSKELHTCGSNALLVVMKEFNKGEQAAKLATLTAPRKEGYNLAELAQLSKSYGVEMRGFRASVQQLEKLPLPLLIHCDFHGSQGTKGLACEPEQKPAHTTKHKATQSKATPAKMTVHHSAHASAHVKAAPKATLVKATLVKATLVEPSASVQATSTKAPATKSSSTKSTSFKAPASSLMSCCTLPHEGEHKHGGVHKSATTSVKARATEASTKTAATKVVATKAPVTKGPIAKPTSFKAPGSSLMSCCAEPHQGVQKSHGHYFVVKSIDASKKLVRLYNPQVEVEYTVRYSDLEKEYSGVGLLPLYETTAGDVLQRVMEQQNAGHAQWVKNNAAKEQRFTWLSTAEMKSVMGGCYVVGKTSGLGDNQFNVACRSGSCYPGSTRGEPSIWVNQVSQNMFIQDTPMWHESTVGPDVNITMSYNSQDSNSYNTPFGNKWSFNYGSHTTQNTASDVTIFMPDGRQDLYRVNTYAPHQVDKRPLTYTSPIGNKSTLIWHGTWWRDHQGYWQPGPATGYTLLMPDDSFYEYAIPAGTTSNKIVLVKETDRWGNSVTLGHDSLARVTTITDALGKVWNLTYDNAGHITQVKDPWERIATFSYDANGNMTECVDMEGHAFQYTYDSLVNVTMLNTAQGPWTFTHVNPENVYPFKRSIVVLDPMQNNAQTIGYDGHEYEYYYDDARGNRTKYTVSTIIEGQGYITSVQYPNNTSESYTWNANNARISNKTDVRNRYWTYTYNGLGNPTQVQVKDHLYNPNAQTRTTNISYATNGLDVLSTTNALSQTPYTYTYNTKHQVTSVTDALNPTTPDTFTYTTWGALQTATDGAGRVTTYNYDSTTKELTSIQQDNVTLVTYTYDAMGRVKTATDATANQTVSYQYNNLDQVTKTTYSDNTYEEVEHVCCGMPGMVRDRSGKKTYYDYDNLKRLVRVQDAAANSIQLEYDASGNMTRLIDGKGSVTRWRYDNMDRAVQKIYADGTYDQYNYTGAVLSSTRNTRGLTTSYTYNNWDDVTLIDYPTSTGAGATPDVSATYDALSRPLTITDGLGTRSFSYDILGRVTGEDGPWANDTLTYHYDSLGRQDWMQVQNSDGTQFQTSYGFDALDRMNSLTSPVGTWSYGYVGNTDKLSTLTQPNGSVTTYGYDALERLNTVANRKSNTNLISGYSYGYDNAQHKDARSWVESQVGTNPVQKVNFGYDDVDQLLSEVSTETTPELNKSYAYDAMGNRTSHSNSSALGGFNTNPVGVSYTANKLNQLLSYTSTQNNVSSTTSLSFDAGGNLTGQHKQGDANPHTTYAYDDLDRLTQVVMRDSNGNLWKKSEYSYDYGNCKAVSREYSWNGTVWVQDSEKRRLYDGMDIVQERDGTNVTTANITRDGNIGGILARTTYSNNTATDAFYHYDGSGNVVQLTDANQDSVAEYSYDAYGVTLTSTGTLAGGNPYRYQTKEATSAGYDFGYRFYSPGLGRWINRDPIEEDGGINLYAMVGNDPINNADEYGLVGPEPPLPPNEICKSGKFKVMQYHSPGIGSSAAHGYHLHLKTPDYEISIDAKGRPLQNKVDQRIWKEMSKQDKKAAIKFMKDNAAKMEKATEQLKKWLAWRTAAREAAKKAAAKKAGGKLLGIWWGLADFFYLPDASVLVGGPDRNGNGRDDRYEM